MIMIMIRTRILILSVTILMYFPTIYIYTIKHSLLVLTRKSL